MQEFYCYKRSFIRLLLFISGVYSCIKLKRACISFWADQISHQFCCAITITIEYNEQFYLTMFMLWLYSLSQYPTQQMCIRRNCRGLYWRLRDSDRVYMNEPTSTGNVGLMFQYASQELLFLTPHWRQKRIMSLHTEPKWRFIISYTTKNVSFFGAMKYILLFVANHSRRFCKPYLNKIFEDVLYKKWYPCCLTILQVHNSLR